jgi:hypothetical protein
MPGLGQVRWPFVLALLIWSLCAGRAAALAEGFGPLPVRNFQPIQLLFLGMPGDRAEVIKKGRLDVRVELAETSTIFNEHTAQASAVMKFEQLRSGLFLRYGLTDRWEVGMEVPALYRYRGFMEGVITATERATTGLSPARAALKDAGFAYNLSAAGRRRFSGTDGDLGLGDITLLSKYQFLSQSASLPAVSLRLAVKVPSGDQGKFFGSGHPDVGIGLAVEKTVAGRWILYGNVNGIVPTGQVSGFALQPFMSGIAAVEYLWSRVLSFTAQFDYYSTPFDGSGLKLLDRGVTESAVGFNYRLRSNVLWQVYGVENLDFIRDSAADFTLSTVITYRFDHGL